MAGKKKQAAKETEQAIHYVVMKDGSRHVLIGQDGKYLYCEDTTIRHTNPMFDRVEAEIVEGK